MNRKFNSKFIFFARFLCNKLLMIEEGNECDSIQRKLLHLNGRNAALNRSQVAFTWKAPECVGFRKLALFVSRPILITSIGSCGRLQSENWKYQVNELSAVGSNDFSFSVPFLASVVGTVKVINSHNRQWSIGYDSFSYFPTQCECVDIDGRAENEGRCLFFSASQIGCQSIIWGNRIRIIRLSTANAVFPFPFTSVRRHCGDSRFCNFNIFSSILSVCLPACRSAHIHISWKIRSK